VVIDYRDNTVNQPNIVWAVNWLVGDGDNLMEAGELGEITIDLSAQTPAVTLGANIAFVIEVKPSLGGTMVIARTTPAGLDPVVDLH
jgi:archaellin